jgi:dihydroorotate dehydrogenase (NAD+) catalytic subunit
VNGVELRVRLGAIELEHPLVNASGTYDALAVAGASGLADFPYAAYFPKTVTLEPRAGNPPPRVTETPSGMINAIGLANPGIDAFLDQLPRLAGLIVPVVVSVGGSRPEDYLTVIERIERRLETPADAPAIAGYELNVSCPNVAQGGLAIGADAGATGRLTAAARGLTGRTLIVKLTPNVTDVVAPARAAAEGGADALALVNTFKAMVLDPQTLRPLLGNRTGGLCGPAIRPIALRMVAEVAAAVDLPIVGMGGVASGQDALDFIACGATAVAIGAAVFADPQAPRRILAELRQLLERRRAGSLDAVRAVALADS